MASLYASSVASLLHCLRHHCHNNLFPFVAFLFWYAFGDAGLQLRALISQIRTQSRSDALALSVSCAIIHVRPKGYCVQVKRRLLESTILLQWSCFFYILVHEKVGIPERLKRDGVETYIGLIHWTYIMESRLSR